MQQATGTYVGDDTSPRTIVTGLSGVLKSLHIVEDSYNEDKTKFDSMGAAYFDPIEAAAVPPLPTGVTFIGADFVVGDPGPVANTGNHAGSVYYWHAQSE